MSIAGGLPRAVDRAVLHGCEALQIFTKSCGQWRARPIPADEARTFRSRVEQSGIRPAVAHASYLINLGASAEPLRSQSIAALIEELDRAELLGLHEVLRRRRRGTARILLEHTAGQGTSLGWRFEHLRAVLDQTDAHPRIGVCLDTCHLVAAGYGVHTAAGVERCLAEFDRLIGFGRLHVVHANDSKRPRGSRVDRHTHIGEGAVGLEGFRAFVNHKRLRGLPMLLETPKAIDKGTTVRLDEYDARNLAVLRGLLERP